MRLKIMQENKEMMDLFWYFVKARQDIWYKRFVLKQPAPWTDDEILKPYNFCNIYS